MRTRQAIYTSRTVAPLSVNGSGDSYRMSVPQKIHSGPAAAADRKVCLVLDKEEALQLAIDLLKKLPVMQLQAMPEQIGELRKIVRMLDVKDKD